MWREDRENGNMGFTSFQSRLYNSIEVIFNLLFFQGATLWCGIDYFKPLFLGIADSISRAAAVLCQVTDTYATVVYQVTVAFVHTAFCVLLGRVYGFIRLGLDTLILRHILRSPSPCLRQAWEDKD